MDDDALVEAFEAGAVTPAQWDHRAHVRVAFVYLLRKRREVVRAKRDSRLFRSSGGARGGRSPSRPRGLRDGDVDAALERMRPGLRRLLEAFGVEDGPTRGFHETLTVAWLRVVRSAMDSYGPYADSAALLEGHPYLLDKRLMRLFYRRDRIASAEAKARFVEPDLTPLP